MHRLYCCGGSVVRRLYDALRALAEGCEASGSRSGNVTLVLYRFVIFCRFCRNFFTGWCCCTGWFCIRWFTVAGFYLRLYQLPIDKLSV